MEIIWHKPSLKKPVITWHFTIIIATRAVTNTLFLTKMQKRAKHTEVKLPFFNNKSSKTISYGKVKISWVMSTGWYQLRSNLLLQNLKFEGAVKVDVISTFDHSALFKAWFANYLRKRIYLLSDTPFGIQLSQEIVTERRLPQSRYRCWFLWSRNRSDFGRSR